MLYVVPPFNLWSVSSVKEKSRRELKLPPPKTF